MKSKKLISLLLAGTMTLPFAFWTASADDELTTIAASTFATDVEGFVGNDKNANFANGVSHTDDGSGALQFDLHHDGWPEAISGFTQTAMLGVGKQLQSFESLNIVPGKKYRVSAYIKGLTGRYHSRTYYMGITTGNSKDGSVGANCLAYSAVTPTADDWKEVSFDWEPTSYNGTWYLRLYLPNEKKIGWDTTDNLKSANNTYDIVYLDDVKIEEYTVKPLELVSVTKGGTTLKSGAYLYNNEKITVEFSKNLQSDQTGAVTVTAEDGTELTPALSVDGTKLYVTIPEAVQDMKYTVKLGTFTALDGDTLDVNTEYTLTADNKTVFYDTFDEDMCSFVQSQKAGSAKYIAEENVSDGKTAGAVRLGLFGLGYGGAKENVGYYGIDRTVGGKIEPGKTYEVSAYIKGEQGRYKLNNQSEFKFALGVYPDSAITANVWFGQQTNGQTQIAVSDEWQKISFLWTPVDDGKTDYSTYRIRINPVSGQGFNEGKVESDENYFVYYIDDVMIREKPSLELVKVTPDDGTVLTADMSGITAEFSLPLGEGSTVTVKNSKGAAVNSVVTVDGVRLNIAIPNRDHGETYTVTLDKIVSTAGDELTVEKSYSYLADAAIMNETFDNDLGSFGISGWMSAASGCADHSYDSNEDNGAARLIMYNSNDVYVNNQQSAAFGIDSNLGSGIEPGRSYVVSAYVKGEPGKYNQGFKFQMGIYEFQTGSYVQDIVKNHPVEIKVTDEWQKMAFVWTAPSDTSKLKLRINPVNEQRFNGTIANYDIFYIDNVSIMPVGTVPSAYLSDVAVTYTDGDKTTAITSAEQLAGKDLTVSCTITNLGASEQPYTVMAAIFDENGKLIDVKAAEDSMAVGGKAAVTITGLDLTNVEESCTMKIFAWDRSNNKQIPLTGVCNPF